MRKLLLAFFITLPLVTMAQQQGYTWVFGDSAGIHFNSFGNPSPFTSGVYYDRENYCSISDSKGNLLFYLTSAHPDTFGNPSNVCELHDKNNQLIENSDSLFTDYTEGPTSVILRLPGDTSKYYLFYSQSLDTGLNEGNKLYYSIIDMSYNNGLGKVVSKNNTLATKGFFCVKQQAVRHANGRDWWIMTHELGNSNFYMFLLTPNGISGPYIQAIGTDIYDTLGFDAGQMRFSEDGSWLANVSTSGLIDIFNFDRCTGKLSNWQNLSAYNPNYYNGYGGCSFSPNGDVLYISGSAYDDSLFQYNLTVGNVKASKLFLYLPNHSSDSLGVYQQQLGPDGRIYIASEFDYPMTDSTNTPPRDSLNEYLTVIDSPNVVGFGCAVKPFSFYLGGHLSTYGLPNEPNYNLGALIGSACDTLINVNPLAASICVGDSATLTVNGATTYIWSPTAGLNTTTGDSVIANPTATTTYVITGMVNSHTYTATVVVTVLAKPGVSVNTPVLVCYGDSTTLTASGAVSYTWSPATGLNATTGSSVIADPTMTTTYIVIGTNGDCGTDTVQVIVIVPAPSNQPTFYQHGDTLISNSLHDNQWYRNDTLLAGDTTQKLIIDTLGWYWVSVNNEANGCSSASDSMYIDSLTGIEQLVTKSDNLSIYPNPTTGEINIVSATHIDDLKVTNLLGQLIYEVQPKQTQFTFDIKDAGIYFATVSSYNETFTKKVVVVK